MTGRRLSFLFGGRTVTVSCPFEEVMAGLRAVWGGCAVRGPTDGDHTRFDVLSSGRSVWIVHDGVSIPVDGRADVLPTIEHRLYRHDWRGDRDITTLHAASVARGTTALLFVAPSGGGKSTFASIAVRHGLRYISDEITRTDGALLWGVGRAIQLDPIGEGESLPPRFRGADLSSYRFRDGRHRPMRLPLIPVPRRALLREPRLFDEVHVLHLEPGPRTRLEPCEPVESLRRLVEAAYAVGRAPLSRFVERGRSWCLRWAEPQEGWDLVARRVLDPAPCSPAQPGT